MGESPKPGVLSFRRIRRLQAPRRIFLFCENFFRKRCPEVLQVLFGLVEFFPLNFGLRQVIVIPVK